MKNIFKITLVSFTTLFLFSCDSSSTPAAKKDPVGNTYTLNVSVTGLANPGTLNLKNGNDPLTVIDGDSTVKVMSIGLVDNTNYSVQVEVGGHPNGQTCEAALGNGTISGADVTVVVNCVYGGAGNGLVTLGRTYYDNNCKVCHKAGSEDPTKAYGTETAMDLARSFQNRVDDRNNSIFVNETINVSMHMIGADTNLMGNFNAVSMQDVYDLKAYLDFICVPNSTRNPAATCL